MEKFYTPGEVQQILRISRPTLIRLIKSGEIHATRLGAVGHLRVAESALATFLSRHTTEGGYRRC